MTKTLEHISLAWNRLCKNRQSLRLAIAAARRENVPVPIIQHAEHVMATSDKLIAELDTIMDFLSPPGPPGHPDPPQVAP